MKTVTCRTCVTFIETGNVFTDSWWKCWNGKEIREVRRMALRMAIPEYLGYCRDCGVFMRKKKYWKLNKLKTYVREVERPVPNDTGIQGVHNFPDKNIFEVQI